MIVALVVSFNCSAQTLYWKPIFNAKWNFANSGAWRFDRVGIDSHSNQYYSFQNKNHFFTKNLGIGLAVGLDFGNKGRVEAGWMQDEVGNGNEYMVFYELNLNVTGLRKYASGSNQNMTQVMQKYFVHRYRPFRVQSATHFVYGLSIGFINSKHDYFNINPSEVYIYDADSTTSITVQSLDVAFKNWNLYSVLGLSHDFKYRERYLFSFSALLNVSLTDNFLHTQQTSFDVNINGEITRKTFSFDSKGSGVLFTISRRLGMKFIQGDEKNRDDLYK